MCMKTARCGVSKLAEFDVRERVYQPLPGAVYELIEMPCTYKEVPIYCDLKCYFKVSLTSWPSYQKTKNFTYLMNFSLAFSAYKNG